VEIGAGNPVPLTRLTMMWLQIDLVGQNATVQEPTSSEKFRADQISVFAKLRALLEDITQLQMENLFVRSLTVVPESPTLGFL
jgi:hypothetical protein